MFIMLLFSIYFCPSCMLEAVAALRDAIQDIKTMLTDPEKNLGRLNKEDKVCFFYFYSVSFYLAPPQGQVTTTAEPIAVTHPVNFPCGRKPEYAEKIHDFRQRVDYTLFT